MRTNSTEMIEHQSAGQGRPAQASTDDVMSTPGQESNRRLEFQTPQAEKMGSGSSGGQSWELATGENRYAMAQENANEWKTKYLINTIEYAIGNAGSETPDADRTRKRREGML